MSRICQSPRDRFPRVRDRSRSTVWPHPALVHLFECAGSNGPCALRAYGVGYGRSVSGTSLSRRRPDEGLPCGGPSHDVGGACWYPQRKPDPPAVHTPLRTERCSGPASSALRQFRQTKMAIVKLLVASSAGMRPLVPIIAFTLCLPIYLSTLELNRRHHDRCSRPKSGCVGGCKGWVSAPPSGASRRNAAYRATCGTMPREC